MTVVYIDADMPVAEPVDVPQRNDLATFRGNSPSGKVPDTALNPVLYRGSATAG
jgi:hypothetical protein